MCCHLSLKRCSIGSTLRGKIPRQQPTLQQGHDREYTRLVDIGEELARLHLGEIFTQQLILPRAEILELHEGILFLECSFKRVGVGRRISGINDDLALFLGLFDELGPLGWIRLGINLLRGEKQAMRSNKQKDQPSHSSSPQEH